MVVLVVRTLACVAMRLPAVCRMLLVSGKLLWGVAEQKMRSAACFRSS